MPHTHRPPFIEGLEPRQLLAFAADINFQPPDAPVPGGFEADTGAVYGDRGSGLTYGWVGRENRRTRDRDSARSPSQRHDTFAVLSRGAAWEIAVPDGTYRVRATAGDPASSDAVYRIDAEGTRLIDRSPTRRKLWVNGSRTVEVTDGRLTVTGGRGARDNRINFIRIREVTAAPPPGPDPGPDPTPSNRPPAAPRITEPLRDNDLVSGADVHMETAAFSDADGDRHLSTDWEIWTAGASAVRVWRALNVTDSENRLHIHLGNGVFEGPQAGRGRLRADTNYELRVRFRDDGGGSNNTSAWSVRRFRTLPEETPTAPGWVSRQSGFRVEEVPFTFAAGGPDWRLPTNIAFVPQGVRGSHPNDPLFYVTELYGTIRVVSNNFTVRTFADNLLNYNPSGPISGTGENGLTGIAVDPASGEVYATMLYDDPADGRDTTYPKVTRFRSNDGGLTASSATDILKMPGESMRQSHIVSNISFGPDGKIYVHVGDGFESEAARDDDRFKGKVLRIERDGKPAAGNPLYNAGDGFTARDYWWAEGYRNPFGGAWREASGSRPAQHFVVENGPGLDRLSMMVKGRDYGWDGSEASMRNHNLAYAASGTFESGEEDWRPAPAPVNIAFVQNSTFGGSGFPASKLGNAFVTLSGPTHAQGPNAAKSIQEWMINDDGTRRADGSANPRELASYEGPGYATAAALAAGPDGLYFSTLYSDTDANPLSRGAKILRIVYAGA